MHSLIRLALSLLLGTGGFTWIMIKFFFSSNYFIVKKIYNIIDHNLMIELYNLDVKNFYV